MRANRRLALLLALAAPPAPAVTLEAAKSAPFVPPGAALPLLERARVLSLLQQEPFRCSAELRELTGASAAGETLGVMALAPQLDRHRSLVRLRLGDMDWDISVSVDAEASGYYMTFANGDALRLAPIDDVTRLITRGVEVELAPGIRYRLRLHPNLLDLARGSSISFSPVAGSRGSRQELNTGRLLDAIRDRSLVFATGGEEYWALYATDARPEGGAMAATRSFLFLRLRGLSAKGWNVPETRLPAGEDVRLELLSPVALRRDAGTLTISAVAP